MRGNANGRNNKKRIRQGSITWKIVMEMWKEENSNRIDKELCKTAVVIWKLFSRRLKTKKLKMKMVAIVVGVIDVAFWHSGRRE